MDESQGKPDATAVEYTSSAGDQDTKADGVISKRGDRALEIIGAQRVILTEEDVRRTHAIEERGLTSLLFLLEHRVS